MGVGNYREDYDGAGRSVNVSAPFTSDEEYEGHVKEAKEQGEEPWTREEYDQDSFDHHNEKMIDVVAAIASDVGLQVVRKGRFNGPRAGFDPKITVIAEGDVVDVGWRSWESDFVVQVGPSSAYKDLYDLEDPTEFAVMEKGRAPARLKADYQAMLDDLEKLIRFSLIEEGLETSKPSSAWTSVTDEAPEDVERVVAELTEGVRKRITALTMGASHNIGRISVEERLEVATAVLGAEDWQTSDLPMVVVPTYDPKSGSAAMWEPSSGPGRGYCSSLAVSDEVRAFMAMRPVPGEDVIAIPFAPETESLFASLQEDNRRHTRYALSAEQFAVVTGTDCKMAYEDERDGRREVLLAEVVAAPVPSV